MSHLPAWLPDWARAVAAVLLHPHVLAAIGIGSVLMFALSAVGVPWFVARLPVDYFSRRERQKLGMPDIERPRWALALRFGRNLIGLLLLLAGVAMLVLPGQGLLTLLVALLLLDFPGKRRLERRIIASRPVLRAVNALRRRAGRPPMRFD